MKLERDFIITTNAAIWWFVFYALQVAHAGAFIAVSTAKNAIDRLIRRNSFTVGALSFAIAPAASDVVPMLTDDAVDMFQEKQKEVEEYTISKLAGIQCMTKFIATEKKRQASAASPKKKRRMDTMEV